MFLWFVQLFFLNADETQSHLPNSSEFGHPVLKCIVLCRVVLHLSLTYVTFFLLSGIRALKVDGEPNDSSAEHPFLGNSYHFVPTDCYFHRVHQQCGDCDAVPTCLSLNGKSYHRDSHMRKWGST